MERRNFFILVAAIIIGMSAFWLSLYAFIILDIDPLQNFKNIFGGEDVVVVSIKGNVKRELQLSVSDIKSDKMIHAIDNRLYRQRRNKLLINTKKESL